MSSTGVDEGSGPPAGGPQSVGVLARKVFEVGILAVFPFVVGREMASQELEGEEFFGTTAQVIATLFVAAAVDLAAPGPPMGRSRAGLMCVLLLESLLGLVAAVRALTGVSSEWLAFATGTGVAAAATLVALRLVIRATDSGMGRWADLLLAGTLAVIWLLLIAGP